ncbi:MAG TPA: cobalamin biosynthesis protein CbiM, partial [Candidatus Competibacteraceae bacterium]|nr:cobalamin biosynthesis protein CbiM [Candidatus Competibacteraceae bacterium]
MHIAEGFLPPLHAALWTALAAPFVAAGVRRANR